MQCDKRPVANITVPLAAAAAILFAAPAASAECSVSAVSVEGGAVSLHYDPFSPEGSRAVVPLRVTADGECENEILEVVIAPDVSSASPASLMLVNGSRALPLEAEDRNGRSLVAVGGLDFTPGRTARLPIVFNQVGAGGDITLGIEPGQSVQSGEYRSRARVLARLQSDNRVVSAPFDVSASVVASVGLAAAGDLRLDLGEIRDGDQVQTRFVAYANTDYELSVRSDNNWAIRSSGGARIPYEVIVSGRSVGAAVATVGFGQPLSDGRRLHDMVVRVPDVGHAPAGEYRDFLTIEISAKL